MRLELAGLALSTSMLILANLSVAIPATAMQGGAPGPNTTDFVAYNRVGIMGIEDLGLLWPGGALVKGDWPLKSDDRRIAFRFTLPAGFPSGRDVSAAWLFYSVEGTPSGQLQVRIAESDAVYLPGTTNTTSTTSHALHGNQGGTWDRVPIDSSGFTLTPGTTYHIEVSALGAGFSASDHPRFHHGRSRFPIPYLPHDPSVGATDPGFYRSPYDTEFASLVDEGDLRGYAVYRDDCKGYTPIFLLEHVSNQGGDPAWFGQPYSVYSEPVIGEQVGGKETISTAIGQRIDVPSGDGFSANYVSFLGGGAGGMDDPKPCGNLVFEVWKEVSSGQYVMEASTALIQGECGSGTNQPSTGGRWHWYGQFFEHFQSPFQFMGGSTYYLMFVSKQSAENNPCAACDLCVEPCGEENWNGWKIPLLYSSIGIGGNEEPPTSGDVPTYLTTISHAVQGRRVGAYLRNVDLISSIPTESQLTADVPFILGLLDSRPIAIYDEGGGTREYCASIPGCPAYIRRLLECETGALISGARNIGVDALSAREIYKRVWVDGTWDPGNPLLGFYKGSDTTCPIPQNRDVLAEHLTCASACAPVNTGPEMTVPFTMPNSPVVKLVFEYGYWDAESNACNPATDVFVTDDVIPFEVRLATDCECSGTIPNLCE